MVLRWHDLGLDRFRVVAGGRAADYVAGEAVAPSASESDERSLDVVYPSEGEALAAAGAIDLRLLARVLLPTLRDHHPETVCAHYGICHVSSHEVEALRKLLAALLDEAMSLDREVLGLLARLVPPPLGDLLGRILLQPQTEPPEPVDEAASAAVSEEDVALDAALGPAGPIASAFPSFEVRHGQLDMADAVNRAFRNGGALLVEAGPGTGKTFAYLIPAILHLRRDRSARLVVSTRTKQLQEQLYHKDLPFLISHLAPELTAALLKGRENYLCLRRWEGLIGELAGSLDHERLAQMAPLCRWLADTETGDIEENTAFLAAPDADRLWRLLCDAPNHCTGAFCPHEEECFTVQARRRARKADLAVVNHSLLLGDLVVDGVVLGKYSHLIVDEAHGLEAVARVAFTRSLSERIVGRFAEELMSSSRRRHGWLERLTIPRDDADVERASDLVAAVRRRAGALLQEMDNKLPDERRGSFVSIVDVDGQPGETVIGLEELERALDTLGARLEDPEVTKELEGHVRATQSLREVVEVLSEPPDDNTVHWFERPNGGMALHATPLDVSRFFERLLYPRIEGLVLTSATLSVAGEFDFLRRSLGLTDDVFDVESCVVESPFAYEDRMRVVVPTYLPAVDGSTEAVADALASLVSKLAVRLDRKGLVLFTSYRLLHAVHERIEPGIATLAQGVDGPRSKLIERFRDHHGAGLLLGTESFWEGVDLPGAELEFLVVTRLPFPVPTDPILAALGARVAAEGRDAFFDLSLPLAVLKLRQGVGRLIRTQEDHGVVVLTDQRVVRRSYGRRFVDSLPVPVVTMSGEEELVGDAERFFGRA